MEFLNACSTVVVALATVAIAILTAYYVYYSHKLWKIAEDAFVLNALAFTFGNLGWQSRRKAMLQLGSGNKKFLSAFKAGLESSGNEGSDV